MCFHFSIAKHTKEDLEQEFNRPFRDQGSIIEYYNGFAHPLTPVISKHDHDSICLYQWGLIPFWAKDRSIAKYTLNARKETIDEKPSFRDSWKDNKRCIILCDGYYEWQWLDEKGKKKQKYHIQYPDRTLFAFAGIYALWQDPKSGDTVKSYSIITMPANEQIAKIHNHGRRMPMLLNKEQREAWLSDEYDFEQYAHLHEVELVCQTV